MRWSIVLSFWAVSLWANDLPYRWLLKMDQALDQLNYRGHFVYLCDQSLQALYIQHQKGEAGQTTESLFSLTGAATEILREGSALTVIRSEGDHMAMQHHSVQELSPIRRVQPELVVQNYQLKLDGEQRIAGRQGVILHFIPKDDYRYAYRMTLDKLTALPLDLSVLEGKRLLSRIMFIDLEIEYTEIEEAQNAKIQPLNIDQIQHWHFSQLPPGYYLIRQNQLRNTEQFIFFDGLSSISIYLEPLSDPQQAFNGHTRIEFINALGRPIGHHQLVAVGEVPLKALQLIAAGIQPKP